MTVTYLQKTSNSSRKLSQGNDEWSEAGKESRIEHDAVDLKEHVGKVPAFPFSSEDSHSRLKLPPLTLSLSPLTMCKQDP